MLDLDFAFFNLIDETRTGLVYREAILDKLAPLLFFPRLEKLIKVPYLDSWGCNIYLPLGAGNLYILNQEKRSLMARKTELLLKEYNLHNLAVDRRLKNTITDIYPDYELIFGENFIKALAHVFIKANLGRYNLRKIILVGKAESLNFFIASLEQYHLPISLQTLSPHRDEIFAHKLMYEKGQAISTSYLTPEHWEHDDLVIVFEDDYTNLAGMKKSQAMTIFLNNYSYNLAPDLEILLAKGGLAPSLFNLAPILESCLKVKAGFADSDDETIIVPGKKEPDFIDLEKIGSRWGLWDYFLDKGE